MPVPIDRLAWVAVDDRTTSTADPSLVRAAVNPSPVGREALESAAAHARRMMGSDFATGVEPLILLRLV